MQLRRIFAIFVTVLFVLITICGVAFAEKRVALVIGNSEYQYVSRLENPKNDAKAIAESLKRLDFEVIIGLDVDRPTFTQKIRDFSRVLRGADIALFFYAGHGLQVNGANYLVPVETDLSEEEDLDFETLRLRMIVSQMEREPRTNLIFLDACRDNPLARNLARSMGTRSASVGRGLAPIETGVGTLIAFATQPGNVALDGDTENSPFTESLVKHIETPGVDVAVLLRRVRQDVIGKTEGKQVPWSNSSLTDDVILKVKAQPKPVEQAKPNKDNSFELTYWNSIKDRSEPDLFEAYLKRYPKGAFSDLAVIRLKTVTRKRKDDLKPKFPDNSAEVAFWNSIKDSKDPTILELYLKQFPDGVYVGLAKYRLSLLADLQKQKWTIADQKSKQQKNEKIREAEQNLREKELENRLALLKAADEDRKQAERRDAALEQLKKKKIPKSIVNPVAKLETKNTQVPNLVQEEAVIARTVIRDIQSELNRLGCDAGKADGLWGKGSKRALKQFGRYGKTKLAALEPSTTLLDQLKAKQARVCPLVCRSGFEKKNNTCVRIKRETSTQIREQKKYPAAGDKAIEISVGGVWKDSEGHSNSFPNISSGPFNAKYRTQKLRLAGKLLGKLSRGTFTGIWTQTWSREKCSKLRHGSPYWGRISFSFDSIRTKFSGKWGHCDGSLHTNITGRKQ